MAAQQTRGATPGILIYLLLGAALGAGLLLGLVILGLDAVGDAVGAALHDQIIGGSATSVILLAFFVFAPLVAVGIAALLGAHAARTGEDTTRPAVAATLFGMPILWVNVAVALLLSAAILDWSSDSALFEGTFDLVIESIVFLVLETAATVAFAALAAGVVRDAFAGRTAVQTFATPAYAEEEIAEEEAIEEPAPPAVPESERLRPPRLESRTPSPSAEAAPPEPRHVQQGTYLEDYPVQCPRCETQFSVSGERPLRIVCPHCEKTGTIR